jgi:hypothetical protein
MSSRSHRFVVALVMCAAGSAAAAQSQLVSAPRETPPLLRLATSKTATAKTNGPTLEFTMEYIQDKLISRGVLSYQVALHDSAADKDWSYDFTDKLSGTYANPSTCQIGFHWKQTRSGTVVTDKETVVDLSADTKSEVLTMDRYLTESTTKAGHEAWSSKVSPSLFVVRVSKPDGHDSNFLFPDEDTANHFAKALAHAAELCKSAQAAGTPAGTKEAF